MHVKVNTLAYFARTSMSKMLTNADTVVNVIKHFLCHEPFLQNNVDGKKASVFVLKCILSLV